MKGGENKMKKSYPYNVLSDKKCSVSGCSKKLKLRIVEEHPKFDKCYKCYKNGGKITTE